MKGLLAVAAALITTGVLFSAVTSLWQWLRLGDRGKTTTRNGERWARYANPTCRDCHGTGLWYTPDRLFYSRCLCTTCKDPYGEHAFCTRRILHRGPHVDTMMLRAWRCRAHA